MVYEVPESKRSFKQNQFEFKLPDGKTYSIPKAKYLTIGQVEKLSSKTTEVSMADMLELFGKGPAAKAARTLDIEQLQELMKAWQDDAGITTGE